MTKTIAIDRSREIALGFLYWLTFLIALEPGNLLDGGRTPAIGSEVLRIVGASLIGAVSAPVVLALMRRFPIEPGQRLSRHLAIHALCAFATAFALIAASCVLAPLMQVGDTRPFLTALPSHLQADWLLLAFSLLAFAGFAQAARKMPRQQDSAADMAGQHRDDSKFVSVRTRGRMLKFALSDVDWIETQGNYLALHVGSATHLLRETLVAFEEAHAPTFVRIHRRLLVAPNRVRAMTTSHNGDADVQLHDGTSLRVSRSYAKKLRQALADQVMFPESAAGLAQLSLR